MQIPRRKLLHLAAGAVALPVTSRIAPADNYPSRPVSIVVGYPAGLAPDIIARLFGQWLSDRFGQQFIVDNRPGAASNIASSIVAKSPKDGYTLLMVVSTNAINATLYKNLNFDFARDLVPVAGIGLVPFVMVVNPALPVRTIPDFIAYAKANPGKINMATSGIGTGPHVSGELFKMMTATNFVHVPYRSNYTPDLLSGQVQLAFSPTVATVEFVRDGRLRALGVTTADRSEVLPEVPTIGEFVPGYVASGWYGLCVAAGTPSTIIGKLNAAISAGAADPGIKTRLAALGVQPKPMQSTEFGQFISDETDKWAKVIKFADIRVE